jgi:hypothetical protein
MIQKRINIRVRYIIDGSKKKESKVSRIDGSKMMMLLLRIDLHLDKKKTSQNWDFQAYHQHL